MDWCGSSTTRTPKYQTMNKEMHERKAYWLSDCETQFLIGGDTKSLNASILSIDRRGRAELLGFSACGCWIFNLHSRVGTGGTLNPELLIIGGVLQQVRC